jgi:hypothetical protein
MVIDEGLAICVKALPRDWNATLGADNRIVADFSSTFYTEHITTPFYALKHPALKAVCSISIISKKTHHYSAEM